MVSNIRGIFKIRNDKGELLLSKRKNRFGAGTYSLVGGKLKIGETIEHCLKREVEEEIGISLEEKDLEVVNMASTYTTSGKHFIQIGVLVKGYTGIPTNLEPHKCEEVAFFDKEHLPELFMATKPNIHLYLKNQFYDKHENVQQ